MASKPSRGASKHFVRGLGTTGAAVLLVGLLVVLVGCQDAVEFTRRPFEPSTERRQPEGVDTKVFVASRVDEDILKERLDDLLPDRLAAINLWLKRAACLRYRGRRRCTAAHVIGEIRRSGPLMISALGNSLEVSIPLSYQLSASGSRFAAELADESRGTLVVRALYEVGLDRKLKPKVAFLNSYHWRGATEVKLLAGTLTLSPLIERKLRSPMRLFARAVMTALDGKSAQQVLAPAWRQLHYPIKLGGDDGLWLRGEPVSVAFAGLDTRSGHLELRYAITTRLRTFVGERPIPLIPIAMPELEREVRGETQSRFLMPVRLDYGRLAARLGEKLPQGHTFEARRGDEVVRFTVLGTRLMPAGGRLAIAAELEADLPDRWRALKGTAYVVAAIEIAPDKRSLRLGEVAFTAPNALPSLFHDGRFILPLAPFVQALQHAVAIDLGREYAGKLAAANKIFNRALGNGMVLRAAFVKAGVHSIVPDADGLRVNLELLGDLVVAPRPGMVREGSVQPTSGRSPRN